jgi:autotransporter-associated beta strand protein
MLLPSADFVMIQLPVMSNTVSRVSVLFLIALGSAAAARAAGTGLTGDYFSTTNFSGTKTSRIDATVNFDWGNGSPGVGGLGNNNFSIRWSGQLEPRYDETCTFYVNADDGATLWVNDRLIVSRLFAATPAQMAGQIALKAGLRVNLRLEYIEKTGNASVRLEWASASQTREVIPQSQLYPTMMPFERGSILREHWANLSGTAISALTSATNYPNRPDGREMFLSFECLQTNWTANVGTRLRGYLMPQTNGLYTFAVAASDTAQLWLSTDTNAANKQLIASVASATGFRDWSNQVSQVSTGRTLVAWQKYYVELLHKAGSNNNHYSVAWQPPGATQFSVMGADYLIPTGLNNPLPSQTNIFNTLAPSHPRLFATAERFAWLSQEVANNPDGQPAQWYASLYRSATNLFAAAPVTYTQDNRGTILTQSRAVKDRMYLLGLAWKISGDTNFPERAWVELTAAGNFPDWHPAHFLDTAEMTGAFGLAYDWFYEYWTPAQRTFIRTNITTKGLPPGLTQFSNNVGWTRSTGNNWNMVCNGGLTLGALAVGTDSETLAEQVLSKTVPSQAPVMGHWTADNGAWYEGPGYWDYASDYNFRMLAALQSALGSDFGLSTTNGLNNAGLFAMLLTSANGRNFNFADAGSAGVSGGPQMIWWARRFDVPAYARYERTNNIPDVLSLLWWDDRGGDPVSEGIGSDFLFLGPTGTTAYKPQHVGVFRSSWGDASETMLSFKGGEMGAVHGCLDAGTFVLEALGNRWAWDLGSDDYALPGYFSSTPSAGTDRWDYYRLRAEGQNTIVINPGNGPDAGIGPVAPVLNFQSKTGVRALSVMDLTPVVTNVTRAWRGFQLLGPQRKQALVQDEIAGATNANVWWFMHYQSNNIQAAVSPDGTSVMMTQGVNRLWAKILSSGGTFQIMNARPLPTSPDPVGQNLNASYQKLAIHLTGVSNTTIAVWFVPLAPGQNPPIVPPAITPLAQWQIPEDDPPLAIDGYVTTPQNTAVDVDLTTLASDTSTPSNNLVFTVANPTNGTVVLLPDGHTARFTSPTNFHGTGQFLYTVADAATNTASAGVVVTVLPSTWYWDTSAAAGLQPTNGNWDSTTATWSSTATGSSPLLVWPPLGNDTAFVGAGGVYTITVVGTQQVNHITTTNGTWTFNGGALKHASGAMIITAAGDTTINTPITADTGLIKDGTATLTLGATNTYAGVTTINAGTLTLGVNNALPTVTDVVIGSTNRTVGHLNLNGYNQTIASLNFKSLSVATDTVSIAAGSTLTISNATTGIALGVGNYGNTIGTITATTRVSFAGGGLLAINAPSGSVSIEPSGTNNAGTALAVLDLSRLSSFNANVSSFIAALIGGKPGNVAGQFILSLATNTTITATNILLGVSANGSGTDTISLGASNTFNANSIVISGARHSGTMAFLAGATSNLTIRGVAGGTSRANIYIGDQAGLAGVGYGGGGSSTSSGTITTGGGTVNARLNQLTLGIGASVASQTYGTGNGTFIFGGNNSTVDVNNIYLGYATLNSTTGTTYNSPTYTGTLTMNGGALIVNSNFFLGYSADNDIANTQKVTGVFNLNGGTATVASNIFLGCATNTIGTVTGVLNLSNGTLNVSADILSSGVTATGIVNLAGATLNMNNNEIGSSSNTITFLARNGTLQNLAQLNGGSPLVKTNTGTLILAGTNTYTGATIISNGTLRLSGRLTASAVTVASNATLAGAGTLGAGLTTAAGALLQFALGTSSDRIDVTGNLTLAGTLNITDAGGFTNTTYTLFTYTGALTYNGVSVGTVPNTNLVCVINTNTAGQVRLVASWLDSVGDGVPDYWRQQYFGGSGKTTNALSAASADPDGDGQINLHEYLAGTDPRLAASMLKVTLSASNYQLTWPSVPGKTYQVEYRADLAGGSWQPLPGAQITAAAGQYTISITDSSATALSRRFYRVRVLPP